MQKRRLKFLFDDYKSPYKYLQEKVGLGRMTLTGFCR